MDYGFKIGELAERSGVSRDALRFYERVGLLDPPRRTASGHRVYDEEAMHRVELIRESQRLGLTLDDIRELFRFQKLPEGEAGERVAERLQARIAAIDRQLSTLRTFRRRLAKALEVCAGEPAGSGSIVERLMGVAGVPNEGRR